MLHNPKVPDDSPFTCFSACKCSPSEKLKYLLDIRDKRLSQPYNSPCRMGDICNQLPKTLNGLDMESTGYHRQCYQGFLKNLDRLQKPADDAKRKHHSPRRHKTSNTKFLSNECIFCEKDEKKKVDGKTQWSTGTFVSWKTKLSK